MKTPNEMKTVASCQTATEHATTKIQVEKKTLAPSGFALTRTVREMVIGLG